MSLPPIFKEYQSRPLVQGIAKELRTLSFPRTLRFMEVCGTHTQAFFQFGLRSLIPEQLEILSGPGCPVCVTPNQFIDHALQLSKLPEVVITTFGDMMKVPGSYSSLAKERSQGAEIKIVYSATEALDWARRLPEKNIVFLAIGFETTAPTIASALLEAHREGIHNFFLLSALKILMPALEALLHTPELKLDGLILPGHVSVITGSEIYRPLVAKYQLPCVVTGFEPVDIMRSLLLLSQMTLNSTPELANEYRRVVNDQGNPKAQQLMHETFEPCDSGWRGIGIIPQSGYCLRETYADHDAATHFSIELPPVKEHPQCICGDVLRGLKRPLDCSLFGTVCTPQNPVGACMVSYEGNCAIYFKYRNET